MVSGFVELEAAKSVLLRELAAGLAEEEVLPAMELLEAFRNSLWQADQLLIVAAQRFALAERHCVSSVEKLVAQVLRISPGEARRRVRAATAVGPRTSMHGEALEPVRPLLAAAQADGQVSPVVVDVIDRALATVELLAPGHVGETERTLVSYSRLLGPVEVQRMAERITDYLDPDGAQPRDAIHADRRALHLTRCRDGMIKLDGRLTPAVGARVRAVLEPLAAPRPSIEAGPQGGERAVPDDRSREQRLHDGLDEACARLLKAGDLPASGGVPATVIITITADQLRTGAGSAECSTGEVLSIPEALRLAVEAEIVPTVMTAAGRPLRLGRTRRLATSSQTLALIARDGGCSFPGCTVPPEWCERHHLIPWADGGTTDLDNLTLLCGYHHGHFAQAGWTATLDPDGLPEWRPPHWLTRGRPPLLNHRIRERHRERSAGSVAAPGAQPARRDPMLPGRNPVRG